MHDFDVQSIENAANNWGITAREVKEILLRYSFYFEECEQCQDIDYVLRKWFVLKSKQRKNIANAYKRQSTRLNSKARELADKLEEEMQRNIEVTELMDEIIDWHSTNHEQQEHKSTA